MNITARRLAALCGLLATLPAVAAPSPLARAIEDFVRINTRGYPGEVRFSVGEARLSADACPAPEVFLPGASRLWGRAHVGVRCSGETVSTFYVPVEVRVTGSYLVTARALPAGHAVDAADLVPRTGDLTQLPASVITDPAQASGALLSVGLPGGQPLRAEMLRRPAAVLQGQQVRITLQGPGFAVSNEGRAVTQALDGQLVQVRLANGQTVNGIARNGGTVEVGY